jgi:hypothetical protein
MLLQLPVPDDWSRTRVGDSIVYQKGAIAIRALPIREHPLDAGRWVERAALKGAPVGTVWNQRVRAELITRDGWPALIVEVVLDHATFKQVRVIALYKFLDYASGAEVQATPEEFTKEREAILDILQGARPDWGAQDTVSLASLLEGVMI